MNKPFKELLDGATPGPWSVTEIYKDVASQRGPIARLDDCTPNDMEQRLANASFISRCNPATMRAVLDALDFYAEMTDVDSAMPAIEALRALNGETK